MKTKLLSLMCLATLSSYAQNGSNGVYSSNGSTVTILEKPGLRKVYGGTIINVSYEGSGISSTMKGAFEHACRLWEENIPTTYPLNITVRFANIANPQCLATVEAEHSGDYEAYDKIYTKRWAMTYGLEYGGLENLKTLEYMRDSRDALITFSSTQPFDYTLDGNNINPNKYDFVTVALQAICRALGFSLKAYPSGNTLNKLNPNNQYTFSILTQDPVQNYILATSGNAYMERSGLNSDVPVGKWYLYSPATFDSKYSLNYFQKDANNNETMIMQPDVISRGSAIRYIGSGLQVFFSHCGWDRSFTVGSSSLNFEVASTDDILPYQPITASNLTQAVTLNNTEEDINTYLSTRNEVGDAGNYVLLKDGSWQKFDNRFELSDNPDYARTSDGYLRLKNITKTSQGLGWPTNTHIKYMLADYIPQIPEASVNSYKASEYSLEYTRRRDFASTVLADDEFVDVEIGFKNTEGCTEIQVEQTDSDYPVPFIYYIDPEPGYFTAFMNKKYPSTLKLTYINSNGETIGTPLTIDLTSAVLNESPFRIYTNETNGRLHYEITTKDNLTDNAATYTINSLTEVSAAKHGQINGLTGNIDVSDLKKGIYVFTVTYKNKQHSIKWMKN